MVMTRPLPATTPRRPQMDRALAMRLAATEYERAAELLQTLAPSDWGRPTDCPAWDVRAMAAHVLGMAEMAASMRESVRQNWLAHGRGGLFIDALTALQVEKHRSRSPEEIVGRMAAIGPRAARGRARTPGFMRGMRIPIDQPVGDTTEPWTLGFLIDTILTRDPWMHRVDISRAVGRPVVLTPEHDGTLVTDVVMEWASRHGEACTLILTGPGRGRVGARAWTGAATRARCGGILPHPLRPRAGNRLALRPGSLLVAMWTAAARCASWSPAASAAIRHG